MFPDLSRVITAGDSKQVLRYVREWSCVMSSYLLLQFINLHFEQIEADVFLSLILFFRTMKWSSMKWTRWLPRRSSTHWT